MSRTLLYDTREEQLLEQLTKMNIHNATKIAQTLQGTIWRASVSCVHEQSDGDTIREGSDHTINMTESGSIIVKVTDRCMSKQGVSKVGHQTVRVHEDIESEAEILKHVTSNKDCPHSIVKFHKFMQTDSDCLLLMEDGGSSLFDFVVQAHTLIRCGKLAVSEWIQMVKVIFKQMVECTEYLHSQKVCHLDISMENFLINDVMVEAVKEDGENGEQIKFETDKVQIKLCDFGLAKLFTEDECLCAKWCGKVNYKSPEVVEKKQSFHAKKNDIWCLGVTLFMMMTGCPPWSVASASDDRYVNMTNGFLRYMLDCWGVSRLVDDACLNLFESIFKTEADRIGLDEIKSHSWLTDADHQ